MRKVRTRTGPPPQRNKKKQAEIRERIQKGLEKRQELREARELEMNQQRLATELLGVEDADNQP